MLCFLNRNVIQKTLNLLNYLSKTHTDNKSNIKHEILFIVYSCFNSMIHSMKNELEHLFNLSLDMLAIVGFDGKLLMFNPAWEHVLGYSRQELQDCTFTDYVFPPDLERTMIAGNALMSGEPLVRFENRYVCKDGSLKWLSWNAIANRDKGYIYAVARDETSVKLTEIQLQLRNMAIEASPMGVTISDMQLPDMPIIYVNSAFERVTGYSPLDSIGRNCRFLQGTDRGQPNIKLIRQALRTEKPVTVVLRNYRKDGTMFFNELNLAPIHNHGLLTHYVGVCNDVTKRVEAEEKISLQNEELLTANYNLALARKEAEDIARLKTQFLATMSHELRTPLNAIIGYTEIQLAGMAGDLNDEQKDYQARVLTNADHLLGLINDVLDISKIEAGRLELLIKPFNVYDWVQELVAQTEALALEKNLTYTYTIDERMPKHLMGDSARIKQIALNLLSNAVKFTDKGFVRLDIHKHGDDAWQLIVEDSGIGIPPHAQDIIFEEFRQVDSSFQRKQGGTGLGLSIVKRLSVMMGGNVRLKSKLGKGSTFTVILPLMVAKGEVEERDI
jgi:PAS domain S-box-containing protein